MTGNNAQAIFCETFAQNIRNGLKAQVMIHLYFNNTKVAIHITERHSTKKVVKVLF